MAYIVPRVLIKQEFSQQPVFSDQPLSAFVYGPQYDLHRYSDTDEKPGTAVVNPDTPELKNAYQAGEDTTYALPSQEDGTFVDEGSVKVFIENAQVEYFPTDISVTDPDILRVANPVKANVYYPNRFSATDLVFKTGNSEDRSADFSNRDVAPGDYIKLNDIDSSDTVTVRVKSLHASRTDPVIGTITNDVGNKANASEDYNDAPIWAGSGSYTGDAPLNTSTNYDGHAALGIVEDTFTVEVTTTGAGLEDARFKITSAAGAFTPKLDVALTAGDVLVIDNADSAVVRLDYTDADAPVVGDKWTVHVQAAVTRLINSSTISAALPFRGTQDTNYTLRVVRGGPLYNGSNGDVCARISITSDQLDSSATVNVASGTAFKVGSYGLKVTISGATSNGNLILGDVYHVPVTASRDSKINIIETYESLPASLIDNSHDWEIESMRYVKNFEIPQAINGDDLLTNWEIDSVGQTITIHEGLQTTNSLILDNADLLSLDVISGNLYVEHKDLVVTNATSIGSITSVGEIEARLGKIDPANPLAQAVYFAALNAQGAAVYFCGVYTDDLDGYLNVLELAEQSETLYGHVPLTFDRAIIDAVVGHVNAQSTPENAHWRVAWTSTPITETELLYNLDENQESYKGTVTDDPYADNTQYTLLTIANAAFITDGVRPTDKVYLNFRLDATGKTIYDTYTVEEVRTETTLTLTTPTPAAINVASKVQVARVYTKDEQINNLALVGAEFNNRRVRAVFPPLAKAGTISYNGYHVAAALAGLRSGVVPHQGLTNSEVLGFDDLSLAVKTYSQTQLNRLAEQGYLIVTQKAVGAAAYVRHQLTTDRESLNTSEDSITTNVDSLSFQIQDAAAPFTGQYNIHPNAIVLLRDAIEGTLNNAMTATYTVRAGNQLLGYEILKFEQSTTFKDRMLIVIDPDLPYPLNNTDITLLV